MRYTKLGKTDIKISRVCLGTMTWGEQNDEADAHEQMDYAVSKGVNFFDTAELYAVPTSAGTQGKTEELIGTWFTARKNRDKIVLATKVSGMGIQWVRDGEPLTGKSVRVAVEGSLKRLQTDYIDLYQLHWPNRPFPHFGKNHAGTVNFHAFTTEQIEDNLLDILYALHEAVKAGKIRHAGLSDDSAWGIMKYLELAKKHNMPRMQSIQNEFSLLCRSDDPYVAEVCVREDVSYLPWSPLAVGILSGKYQKGAMPADTRLAVEKKLRSDFQSFRMTPDTEASVNGYLTVAKKHGLDPCQMALKFVDLQPFVASTIIGATKMNQLESNIAAFDLKLSAEVLRDIDTVYRRYPLPY
jgi:aryl-alcohol dehydrogenase-like predicted oxidoreductase